MDADQSTTANIDKLLARLRAGDDSARDALIEHACDRLSHMIQHRMQDYPVVARWEHKDDVLQQAAMRLYRSLSAVKPENARAFMGLASTQIRRELIDMARKLRGPEGLAANLATDAAQRGVDSGKAAPLYEGPDDATGPTTLRQWTEFHQYVEQLPCEEREVFDLCFYQGMTRIDAAGLLGISERTVKRRFQSARLLLHKHLFGEKSE